MFREVVLISIQNTRYAQWKTIVMYKPAKSTSFKRSGFSGVCTALTTCKRNAYREEQEVDSSGYMPMQDPYKLFQQESCPSF